MRRIVIVVVLTVAGALVALYFSGGSKPAPVARATADAAAAPAHVDAAPLPAPQADAARAMDASPAAPLTAATAAGPLEPREPRRPREPRAKPEKDTEPPAKAEPPAPKVPEPQADAGPTPPSKLEKLEPPPVMPERKLGRVTARHRNRMGSNYVLQKVTYELDGQRVFERQDPSGALDRKRDFDAFDKTLEPGQHILVVRLIYRGSGFGVFKYLEGFRFDVHSDYTFTANPGHHTEITVEAVEKGGASIRMEDRPLIKFSSRSVEDRPAAKKR
jgi:hypothetical protein